MVEGIDGQRITLRQARGVPQQEPQFGILRRRFRSLLRVRNCGGVIVSFQSVLSGTGLTSHINPGTPTEVRAALLCIALRLLVGFVFGSRRGPAATDVVRLAKALAHQAKDHDNAKARERNPAFHVITTLYKA